MISLKGMKMKKGIITEKDIQDFRRQCDRAEERKRENPKPEVKVIGDCANHGCEGKIIQDYESYIPELPGPAVYGPRRKRNIEWRPMPLHCDTCGIVYQFPPKAGAVKKTKRRGSA